MTTYKITLAALGPYSTATSGARKMDGLTLDLLHLPRKGDYIRDDDYGDVEVVKVCFNTQGGITLYIQ